MLATLIPRAILVLVWRENGQKLCQEMFCLKVALLWLLSIPYGVLCFQSEVMFAENLWNIFFLDHEKNGK